jgi:hypothetical protein
MTWLPHYLRGASEDPDRYVRRIFGEELVRVPLESLLNNPLSVNSGSFLEHVGLPCSDRCLVDRFTLSFEALRAGLQPLGAMARIIGAPLKEPCAEMLCLDVNVRYGRALCVDPYADAAVYDIALERDCAKTFLNSGVDKLGVFLAMYVAYCREPDETATNEEACAVVRCMREIDPVAFGRPENWWAAVGEELESDVF